MRKVPAILLIALFTLAPAVSFAADGVPVTLKSIETFVTDIIDTVMTLAALAVVGGLAYAGFLMVTSGANPERYKKGKQMLYQVVIGGVVIFGVGVIANTIANFSRNPTGTGTGSGSGGGSQCQPGQTGCDTSSD